MTRADDPVRWEAIDDAVERWHVSPPDDPNPMMHKPLNEYLGWTWKEYVAFVERCELPPKREGAM